MHDACAVGCLFSSRVIAIPVLIVTMLAGPSKLKAPAYSKCQCHLYLAMAKINLEPLHSYNNNIIIFYCYFALFCFLFL